MLGNAGPAKGGGRRRRVPRDQRLISSFFRPAPVAIPYWRDRNILNHPNPLFHQAAQNFRMQFELHHTTWFYLGTIGDCCYYCDHGCFNYYAYSPLHNGEIVGNLCVEEIDHILIEIDIRQKFQRQRIGANLVKFADNKLKQQYGQKRGLLAVVAPKSWRPEFPEESYLTEEGKKLINWCCDNGFLPYEQQLGNSPPSSQVASEASSSPRRRPRNPQRYSPF